MMMMMMVALFSGGLELRTETFWDCGCQVGGKAYILYSGMCKRIRIVAI